MLRKHLLAEPLAARLPGPRAFAAMALRLGSYSFVKLFLQTFVPDNVGKPPFTKSEALAL